MNDRDTNPHTIGFTMNDRGPHDQRLLDMLVDGELADDQRRELLVRLNETPDGWRRCALAFLEAQSWRREMGVVVREPTGVVTIGGVTDFGASIGSTSCGAVANGHLDGRGIVAHATRRSSRAYFTPLAMAAPSAATSIRYMRRPTTHFQCPASERRKLTMVRKTRGRMVAGEL